jgi:hypothetical protein
VIAIRAAYRGSAHVNVCGIVSLREMVRQSGSKLRAATGLGSCTGWLRTVCLGGRKRSVRQRIFLEGLVCWPDGRRRLGESRFEDDVPPPSNFFDIDGSVVGATLGFNVQFRRNWVAGIEADISYSDIGGSFGPGNLRTPSGTTWTCAPGACETDVTWFGTMRGRLGYTSDRLLIFGTGGACFRPSRLWLSWRTYVPGRRY